MIPSRNSSSRLSGYAVPFICMVLLLPFGAHGDTGRGNTTTRETRILHQLQSRHARERLQAIREAVSLPHLPHEIGSALMQLMEHDPDYKIRLFAIEQFGGCPAPSPLPEDLEQALAKALRDREPAIRRAAAQALAQDCLPAPQDQRTLRALATLLKDQDPVTRSFAAHALARSRPASDCSVVEGLTRALDDPDINVRISARQALARHLPGCPGGSERLAEYLAGAGDNAPDWIRGIAETYRSGIRRPPGHNSLATILRRRLEKSTSFPSDDLLDAAGAVLPASELALTLLELAIDHENWEDSLRGLLIERAVSTDSAALMKRREKVFELADRYLSGHFSSASPLEAIHAMGPEATRLYVEHLWRHPARLSALLNVEDPTRFFSPPPGRSIPPDEVTWLRRRLQSLNPDDPADQVRLLILAHMINGLGDRGAALEPDIARFRRNPQTREIVEDLTKRWHGR